jgi:flagellar hook-associated protein 1 FlgK
MLGLRNAPFLDNNTQTLNQFYEGVLTFVGVRARSNEQSLQTQQAFADDFQRRRLEMQGVNLDEEVTNLLLVQRAFEASARIVTTTDRMLETLLGIVA